MPASTQPPGPPLLRVESKTAADACPDMELGEEAQAVLEPEHTPREYLDRLVGDELLHDALRFLARAMPKALGVRWARDCVRQELGDEPTEQEQHRQQLRRKLNRLPQ